MTHTLHTLITEHGLKNGDVLVHDQSKRFFYSHYSAPLPSPVTSQLGLMNAGTHYGINADGQTVALKEGPFWRKEGATKHSTWEAECKALWIENTDLCHALHLAIASPKGVVPRMAERFYQPDHPALRDKPQRK